ncbi:MAG: hypothetical protein BAA04_05075 [Firmicutes bacterium ZCTH02-B6]|nr:MAG: hypothetical protein BAA04_05075 [Firmicutes bacterium ZCTH02-B6]
MARALTENGARGSADAWHDAVGRHRPAHGRLISRVIAAWVLVASGVLSLVFPALAQSRTLPTRLGGAPGGSDVAPGASASAAETAGAFAPFSEVSPAEAGVLAFSGPMAADRTGRLLMVVPAGDGYGVLRLFPALQGTADVPFETVYRRKGVVASGLAVGPDGSICIGWNGGLDCIDPEGRVGHLADNLLVGTIAVTIASDGYVWALRSAGGGTSDLQLVRVDPGLTRAQRVLTLRRTVQGFAGNGLAAGPGGSVLLPVIENGLHRVLRVEADGQFSRVQGFFQLGGGVVLDGAGAVYVPGVKRPQSTQEQRNPQDVVFVHGDGIAAEWAARFPLQPSGARFSGHLALGGDGTLYLTRWQRVMLGGAPAERFVLWRVPVGRAGLTARGNAIDFRIPFLNALANPRLDAPHYAGPVVAARGAVVELLGINFDGKRGQRRVLINGEPAPIQVWTEDRILVRIPLTAPGGPVAVQVAIDGVVSNEETLEVKTPEVPGWFQIGSPAHAATLRQLSTVSGYSARIIIAGVTDSGERVHLEETMETPGLFQIRLPNGRYQARFSAAYLQSAVMYGNNFSYLGSSFAPVQVPEQATAFRISDQNPVVVWTPDLMASPPAAAQPGHQPGN